MLFLKNKYTSYIKKYNNTNKNYYKGSKEIRTLNRFIKSETLYLLSYTSNLYSFNLRKIYYI